MPCYVVTQPESIRGVYETWDECKSKVDGVAGARYQKVEDRAQAEAMLAGGVVLSPGLHVFTDGNDRGGVGVVVVSMADRAGAEPAVVDEIATTAPHVFHGAAIPGLDDDAVRAALARARNVVAELAGLYLGLSQAPEGAELTIVHDYEGVAAWFERRWVARDAAVVAIVAACRDLAARKRLRPRFVWQRGHASGWAGRHDLARFNARADELATQATARG